MVSAGILLYRWRKEIEILLVHMGGPYWKHKDEHSWSIPKGIPDEGEQPAETAKREFHEETGLSLPNRLFPLPQVKQKSGKTLLTWTAEGDADVSKLVSNLFELEWPPRSGSKQFYPEVDRAAWFTLEIARTKIVKGQLPLLLHLEQFLTS